MNSFARFLVGLTALAFAGAVGAQAKYKNVDELLAHADKCHDNPASCRKDLELRKLGVTLSVPDSRDWTATIADDPGIGQYDALELKAQGRSVPVGLIRIAFSCQEWADGQAKAGIARGFWPARRGDTAHPTGWDSPIYFDFDPQSRTWATMLCLETTQQGLLAVVGLKSDSLKAEELDAIHEVLSLVGQKLAKR